MIGAYTAELFAAGVFLLLFGTTMVLFRFEYKMPRLFSGILSFVVVTFGVSIAFSLAVIGPFTLPESTGYTGVGLIGASIGAAVVR